MLATQAEFARTAVVSRTTITVWKSRGSLVMQGDMVDVEKTLERIHRFKRHGAEIVEKVIAALARGVTGNASAVTLAAEAVTPGAGFTSPAAPRLPYAAHLQGEEHDWDRGALAMGVTLGHRMGGVAALSAYEAGLPLEAAKQLEKQMTVNTFQVVEMVLKQLAVPAPKDCPGWMDTPMICREDLAEVNWAKVEADAA